MALDCDDGIHVLPSGASYSSLTLIQFPLITRSLILKDEHPGLVGKIISIALEYQPNNVPGPREQPQSLTCHGAYRDASQLGY